jgi:predicted amidohydrolase
MEEQRLRQENQLEQMRITLEQAKMAGGGNGSSSSPIHIHSDNPIVYEKQVKPRKRKGTIITDDQGNPVGIDIEEIG